MTLHNHSRWFLGLALLLAAGLACLAAVAPATPAPLPPVDARLVQMTNDFAFRLYHALAAKGYGENIFISPTSIEQALAMIYNGAAGPTKADMATTLGLRAAPLTSMRFVPALIDVGPAVPVMTDDEFNKANGALLALLQQPDPGVTLSIANALWGQQGITFNANFLQRNAADYQAETRSLDFSAPAAAADAINQWVKEKTQGVIPTLVTQDNIRKALLVLTNALYFKGKWTLPFDPAQTQDGSFTLADGTTKTLPMMHNTAGYSYLETDQFQAVSLPYGSRRIRCDILLPKPGVTLAACAANVTPANWAQWMKQFSMRTVALTLPRFTASYETSLKATLTALGMGRAFDQTQGDFSGMLPPAAADRTFNLYLLDTIHKTALKVDEDGTVAVAVTGGPAAPTAMVDHQPIVTVTVDHPFLIAIRDRPTGTLLFWGSIAKP